MPAARADMLPRDRALAMLQPYAADFGLADAGRELMVKDARSEHGRSTTRFQQTHRGIPVMGGELVVNANDGGGLLSINGEIAPDLDIDANPRVSADLAQEAALQAMVKIHGGAAADYAASEPELWIYDSRLMEPDGTEPGLVWRMNVGSADGSAPINELVLIDAVRGNVRLNFNQIDTSWSAGAGSLPSQDEAPTPVPTEEPTAEPEAADPVRAAHSPEALLALDPASWYVSTTGSDTDYDCLTPASPCLTINNAIGKASAGDTILVAEGTYTGTGSYVVSIPKDLSILGGWDPDFSAQEGFSTIDGEHVRSGITTGGMITIERFIIQNGKSIGRRNLRRRRNTYRQ